MKKKIIILVAAATMALQTSTLYAVEKDKSMQMGAGNGDMGVMKQNMHKMMEQMDDIHASKDPAERKKLMHEHMQNMQKGMKMMRGMGGNMMMGMMSDKKGSAGMMDKGMGNNMSSKEKGQRHQMMEQRMDMMQMMMEQMMGQMSAQEGKMSDMKK